MAGPVAGEIVVAVAAHRPCRVPSDPCYMPVHAGAALRPGLDLGFRRDDEGDSISERNASYSELTALYWLWKNVDAGAKGLVHYRRLLASPDATRRRAEDPLARVAAGEELAALLSERPAVVARRRDYVIERVGAHYAHTMQGGEAQLAAARAALSDGWPAYVPAWDASMRSTRAHLFNMLVMRDAEFDAYCEWLFAVLAEVERRYDGAGLDAFSARWPGRVAELLLDPWLKTNGVAFSELPVVHAEPVDWPAKARGFLAAKFLGRKYGGSF